MKILWFENSNSWFSHPFTIHDINNLSKRISWIAKVTAIVIQLYPYFCIISRKYIFHVTQLLFFELKILSTLENGKQKFVIKWKDHCTIGLLSVHGHIICININFSIYNSDTFKPRIHNGNRINTYTNYHRSCVISLSDIQLLNLYAK